MSNWRSSLATKLLTLQILGFTLILAGIGVFQYRSIRSQIYQEIENIGESVGQAFQEMLIEHPQLFNTQALEPVVLRFTTKLTNFYHVSVIDYNGHVIADSNLDMVGANIDQGRGLSVLQESGEPPSFSTEGGQGYLHLSYLLAGPYDPVRKSTVMGAVLLTLHLSHAESRIRADFIQVMLTAFALLLGFWVLQYFAIQRGLLRWIRNLTFATERFGAGEFSVRATVPTHDEVGRLAETFNHMATEMQNSTAALQSEIAERKQTEAALLESETRYRDLFGSASDIIISLSLEGTILKANRALEELMGWSLEEVVGQHFRVFLTPASLIVAEESIRRVLLEKQPFSTVELEGRCKDGSIIRIEVRGRLVSDREEKSTGFEWLCRDTTAHKRAEDALQTAKAAEEANRLKSDFLATMSHEIRTPMNGVIGMLGLLMGTEMTPRQRDIAQTAHSSADNLLAIINDILDFSHIEANKMVIEPVAFDLREVVEQVAAMVAFRADEKGVEVLVRYGVPASHPLVGDSGRIRQVLTNLAGNAVKFTAKGHVLLSVEGEEVRGDDMTLRFSVTDTGIGIAADRLEQVFEQFTQAEASTTRQYGGTGLGLAISKCLSE